MNFGLPPLGTGVGGQIKNSVKDTVDTVSYTHLQPLIIASKYSRDRHPDTRDRNVKFKNIIDRGSPIRGVM